MHGVAIILWNSCANLTISFLKKSKGMAHTTAVATVAIMPGICSGANEYGRIVMQGHQLATTTIMGVGLSQNKKHHLDFAIQYATDKLEDQSYANVVTDLYR